MLVSILHRITGGALTIVGLALLAWWLSAIAAGEQAYESFAGVAGHWLAIIVLIGLSWAWFQHLLSGIRHLFMDAGRGLEIGPNKTSALATLAGSAVLTALLWIYLLGVAQ